MTKVLVQGFGWVYVVVLLDWHTKKIVGYHAGIQCTTRQWRAAPDMAVDQQFPHGAQEQGLSLMGDNGGQPTSFAFMEACRDLGLSKSLPATTIPGAMPIPSAGCPHSKKNASGSRSEPVPLP
jgi:putative transposase